MEGQLITEDEGVRYIIQRVVQLTEGDVDDFLIYGMCAIGHSQRVMQFESPEEEASCLIYIITNM